MNISLSTSIVEITPLYYMLAAIFHHVVHKLNLRLILLIFLAAVDPIKAIAENTSTPPYVSTYYYGPNAFPIPDILETTCERLKIGVAGDCYWGKNNSTQDILLRTNIPLWTSRANLSLWWQAYERYHSEDSSGGMSGDVYVSIDLLLFEEKVFRPTWTLRAALKTASGGGYDIGRYYDCPGYFFDSYFGKKFLYGNIGLRICAGGGFLCWQTDNGQQNDAVQYGVMVGAEWGKVSLSGTFSGYTGWQSNSKDHGKLVHDRPMSIKINVVYTLKKTEVIAMLQQGLRDYPFTHLQLGVNYYFDILATIKK